MNKDLFNKILRVAGIVFLVLVFIGILSAIFDNDPTIEKVEQEKTMSVPIEREYKKDVYQEFQANFVGGCSEEGGSNEMCQCMFDELEKELGMDGLLQMSVDYIATEKMPTRAVEAVLKCYE